MIKFIATDMDGTLLNSDHQIPGDFDDTIELLLEKDVKFAISTGRNYLDIENRLNKYTDKLLFICENGASIHYKNECIYSNFLPKETVEKLVLVGRKVKDAYPMLCTPNGIYVENARGIELFKENFPLDLPIIKVDSLLDVEDGVFKVNMFDMVHAEINSYPVFKEENIEGVTLAVSGNYWLDMSAEGVHKGHAIKRVQEMFDISYDETMVFGDFLNDLEMMKSAHHSYAMKNGHDDVKEIANFETKYTNEECGVTKTIKEVVLSDVEVAI